MEPNEKSKSHITRYILTFVAALFLTPLILILVLTQGSIAQYPTTIKPTEEFCLDGYFLFPNHFEIKSSMSTTREVKNKVRILNRFDIFAKTICFKPTTLLPESSTYTLDATYLGFLDSEIFQRTMTITTQAYPQVKALNFEEQINNDQILKYDVDYTTDLLDYSISLNDQSVTCSKEITSVFCDISGLGLAHGSSYKLSLVAKYKDNIVKQLNTVEVTTRTALLVESSSIENKAVLQTPSIPEIDITFNKEIQGGFQIVLEDSNKNQIKFENTLDGKNILIYPKENFKQNTSYSLKITGLIGLDGSSMENGYTLEFSISDGPRISGTNIVSGFSTTSNIILYFNQSIKNPQDIKTYIKLNSGTDYSYSIYKNQVTINPNNNLDLCAKYSVSIGKGLISSTGLVSSVSPTYILKTTCKRTASIGTSVQGRGIYAYYFGNGSKKIVFFAAIHGSEANTKTLLTKWITELENKSDSIPADKTIIIIPTVNPDGITNRSRFNANGVDLNRNFETPTWTSGTYLQNDFYPTGGGSTPFSEVESVDIRDFIINTSPYLTITYHSAAGYVIPSATSRGVELGHIYSQLSGYRYVAPGGDGAFTYDITGTFEEWAERRGYNALVVELSSAYYDQFTQNVKAMWDMVNR